VAGEERKAKVSVLGLIVPSQVRPARFSYSFVLHLDGLRSYASGKVIDLSRGRVMPRCA